MNRIAILGAGGMGTALSVLLDRTVAEIALWTHEEPHAAEMRRDRENRRFLPGVPLRPSAQPTADDREATAGAELLLVAIPTAFLRGALTRLAPAIAPDTPVLSVVKGIEQGTFARPSQIITEVLGERPLAVLSGPSHAEEVARGLPASVVVAGSDEGLCTTVRDALMSPTFRVYLNTDLIGVELAGALKNILGIAAGICEGLGFGDNAKAALLTRGLVEIARLAETLGGRPETFWGLAGVGDVLTTCYSGFGRNRSVGLKIGQGFNLGQARADMAGVAEGVYTTLSVHALAVGQGIPMPITAEVHAILFEGKNPRDAVTDLMLRGPKSE